MNGTGAQVLARRNRIEPVEQRKESLRLVPRDSARSTSAAASVSVGALPLGRRRQPRRGWRTHSAVTRVTQPASTIGQRGEIGHRRRLAAVERVLDRARPSRRFARSTKFGTLPAAMRRPSAWPCDRVAVEELRVGPHRGHGRHLVDDDARGGSRFRARRARKEPGCRAAPAGAPPLATRYRIAPAGASAPESAKCPSASVLASASRTGASALAAQSVTAEPSTGPPPARTCPSTRSPAALDRRKGQTKTRRPMPRRQGSPCYR